MTSQQLYEAIVFVKCRAWQVLGNDSEDTGEAQVGVVMVGWCSAGYVQPSGGLLKASNSDFGDNWSNESVLH